MARNDRAEAVRLRRDGRSYNEIRRLLNIPKSTLSGWFRNIRLSATQRQHLMTKNQQVWSENIIRYNKLRAKKTRQRTQREIFVSSLQIGNLSQRELRLIGTALYWAEGGKGNRWRLQFSNTDPFMVRLMMRFFREVCRVPLDVFSAQIHLHPNISEQSAKRFWSRVAGIPCSQFMRSQHIVSRSSQGKRPPRRLPYGTFHLYVRRISVRNQVHGWISGLQQSLNGMP